MLGMEWVGDQVAWWTLYAVWLVVCLVLFAWSMLLVWTDDLPAVGSAQARLVARYPIPLVPGDDGLTWMERHRLARQYMATAGRIRPSDEMNARVWDTYPGHDMEHVTIGACSPNHPCPACVTRIQSEPEVDRETDRSDDPAIVRPFLTGRESDG